MIRDVNKYIKDTYKHVPEGYDLTVNKMQQIRDIGNPLDEMVVAWKLGFEQAYRAAKAGKFDFQ